MQAQWREFLTRNGAVIDGDTVRHFGQPEHAIEPAQQTVLCDLSHLGVVRVGGEDAPVFLQGQLTNDIRGVDTDHSQLSAMCSPKGRMLAAFRIFERNGEFHLSLPRPVMESTLKRLKMFVLRSQVEIEDVSDALVHFGFAGPDAEERLRTAAGEAPGGPDEVMHIDDATIVRIPDPLPRFEIVAPTETAQRLWERLSESAQAAGVDTWHLLDIRAGIPSVVAETVEAFVPQMANLHVVNGVSFKKGCYTGQEVVARMQYLGKLKRRMYRAHIDAPPPAPGSELYAEGSSGGQGTGKVVDARPSPGGGSELLAVIQIADVERGAALHVDSADGPGLELQELPYAFPATEAADAANP